MLSTEAFFAAAKAAGMTREVKWTPSGGPQQTVDVIFKEPTRDVLSGEAFTSDPEISYPATLLTGLLRGDSITINTVAYKLREDPRSELDGSRMRVAVKKD